MNVPMAAMKLRIFPQTKDVRAVILDRIASSERVINTAQEKLDKLNESGLILSPGLSENNLIIERSKKDLETYTQQVAMLDSHGKPETMMEIDL